MISFGNQHSSIHFSKLITISDHWITIKSQYFLFYTQYFFTQLILPTEILTSIILPLLFIIFLMNLEIGSLLKLSQIIDKVFACCYSYIDINLTVWLASFSQCLQSPQFDILVFILQFLDLMEHESNNSVHIDFILSLLFSHTSLHIIWEYLHQSIGT